MSRLALIADLHLSDVPGTSQWACLNWVLDVLRRDKPDAIVVAGDVTSCGQVRAAREFRTKLEGMNIPFVITHGNADLRGASSSPNLLDALITPKRLEINDAIILALDSSRGTLCENDVALCEKEFASSGGKKNIIATHQPLNPRVARSFKNCSMALFLAGHRHQDDLIHGEQNDFHVVRGLDPDKAVGGPPCLSFFEWSHGKWLRHDEVFSGGSPEVFDEKDRLEFLELLGICCLNEPFETLSYASANLIRCVELRSQDPMESDKLADAISVWRDTGGKVLSFHMPSLQVAPDAADVTNHDIWPYFIEHGIKLGINQLTIHTPDVPVSHMKAGVPARKAIVKFMAKCLGPVIKTGVKIGIENMHMRSEEPVDERRRFGYLPDECFDFIQELRKELGHKNISALIDIGHARNNLPFSKRVGVSDWYAQLGADAVGYHLHQVKNKNSRMTNHLGFDGLYGPLISLSGFLWAWKTGQLRHAPVFVEVRDMIARQRSFKLLHDAMV